MSKKYIYIVVIIAVATALAVAIYFFYEQRMNAIEQKIQQPP